jgi:hypothetical protein
MNWYFRKWIDKKKTVFYENGNVRYIERVPWDTIGLIIYRDQKKFTIENNPWLSQRQIINRLSKLSSMFENRLLSIPNKTDDSQT